MLEDRREYPCQTQNMSPGSVALTTPIVGRVGERVVAYIDHIGRVEGQITRAYDGGFAMTHRRDAAQEGQARRQADVARQSP